MIGKVRERMPERRQLPVEHRENARFDRVKDEIVDPVIAVHEGAFVAWRDMIAQPVDDRVHIGVAPRRLEIGRAHVELQSLMRISYAVLCLKKKKKNITHYNTH